MKDPLSVYDIIRLGTETLNFVKKSNSATHSIIVGLVLTEAQHQYQTEKELHPYNKMERMIDDWGLDEN